MIMIACSDFSVVTKLALHARTKTGGNGSIGSKHREKGLVAKNNA